MDRLRALEYFIAAAELQSFTGAARQLAVSVPAIAKQITALERTVGTQLFERSKRGLALTADGQAYLDACRPLVAGLNAIDDAIAGAATRTRGVVVVGAPAFLVQHCLVPALPRFHALYPDIRIDFRQVDSLGAGTTAIDVFVVLGWPKQPDLVHRTIAQTRLVACAAPAYWAARGMPLRPSELVAHDCLLFRTPAGTVMDLWQFRRADAYETVAVSGWVTSDHRDVVLELALNGEGVARLTDLTIRSHLRSGRLVAALADWEMQDSPPVNLLFRSGHRRSQRVRLWMDFVTALFREYEQERVPGSVGARASAAPQWHARRYPQGSAAAQQRVLRR